MRKVTWHVLRHTFATNLAAKGAPLHVVQALLGHASIATTMRYAHVAPSALRAAIDMLNPRSMLDPDFGQPVGNQWHHQQVYVGKQAGDEGIESSDHVFSRFKIERRN